MMQAKRDKQAVGDHEYHGANAAKVYNPGAESADGILNRAPDHAEQDGQHQHGAGGDHRHKAFAGEEAEPVRKLDIMVFLYI